MQYDIALWSLHHSKLYFSGSNTCFMYSILLLPVYSLFKRFRYSNTCFITPSCCCLCTVCSNVSDTLILAICVWCCSCLCKVCSRVSEPLLLVLRNLSICFVTNNSSSDSNAYLRSLHSQAPQWRYSMLPFLRCEGMATVTNLPLTYGITLCAYLSQTHGHIELHYHGSRGGGVIPICPVITTATEVKILTVNFSQFLDLDC